MIRERDRGERKSGVAAASGARRSIHTCFRRRGSIGARGTLPATSGAHGNGDAAVWLVQASMLARDGGVLVVRVRAAPPCAGESTGVDALTLTDDRMRHGRYCSVGHALAGALSRRMTWTACLAREGGMAHATWNVRHRHWQHSGLRVHPRARLSLVCACVCVRTEEWRCCCWLERWSSDHL